GGGGGRGQGEGGEKGGGGKRLIEMDPTIEANFHKVLEDHTAGDPMRADVKWTNLSRRQIAKKLGELGTPVGRDVVSQLLRKHGYGRRKARKTKTMGPRHPDRNAHFENIGPLKQKYLKAGWRGIIAVTRKKERRTHLHPDGSSDPQGKIEIDDQGLARAWGGAVIPHGICDDGGNEGYMHVNARHEASELGCDSIAMWWEGHGRLAYPQATKLLVRCDGGGSNS